MAKKKATKKAQEQSLTSILGQETGFEEADHTAYQIPMLTILQKLSPQVDKDEPAYIKGAKPGMIYHTIRQEVYEAVNVSPAFYRKVYLEWVLRENGGGFRGEHGLTQGREMLPGCNKNDKGQFILANGNQLAETANHYVMFEFEDGEWEPVLISMSSSQLKASRLWMSQLKSQSIKQGDQVYTAANGLQMNAYQWTLATEQLSNDKGKWYGWTLERGDDTLLIESVAEESNSMRMAISTNRLTYNPEPEAAQQDNAL
jgi:hypothetical protein